MLGQGYDVGGDLSDPQNRFHLIAQQREAEALYKTQFAICGQNMGDALRYMGTTTVVRDIDFIARSEEHTSELQSLGESRMPSSA